MSAAQGPESLSPYLAIERRDWAELGNTSDQPLTEAEIAKLRGLGDFLDIKEVSEVYLPVSQLLSLYAKASRDLHQNTEGFYGQRATRTPFIIGIAGSVAVGKSTAARLLKELMSRWEGTPSVELVTTDGFLYPNEELERRGLLSKRDFQNPTTGNACSSLYQTSNPVNPMCRRQFMTTLPTTSCRETLRP